MANENVLIHFVSAFDGLINLDLQCISQAYFRHSFLKLVSFVFFLLVRHIYTVFIGVDNEVVIRFILLLLL